MRPLVTLFVLLTAVGLLTLPATAHHSVAASFDISKEITVEGTISRLEWVNPHILMYLDVKNAKGESEQWILQGFAPNMAVRGGLKKEQLVRGASITVRGWPTRPGQVINGRPTAYTVVGADPAQSFHIVEAGQIKLSNGEIETFGRGPGFEGSIQR